MSPRRAFRRGLLAAVVASAAWLGVPGVALAHHPGGSVIVQWRGGGGWGWGPWWPWWYGWSGPARVYVDARRSRWAAVKTDVEPDEASLYLDGRLIGTADDFDGYPDDLYLGAGKYHLEFRLDGYTPYSVDVDAAPGRFFRISYRLKKIPGAKHYGTYNPPEPPGGVRRYFEKNRTAGEEAPPPRHWRRYREPASPRAPEGAPPPQAAPGTPVAPPVAQGSSRLLFRLSPGDAAVYLDNRYAGTGSELSSIKDGLAVSPGSHEVTVVRPGYRTETRRVEAPDGGKATVEIALSGDEGDI